MLGGDSFGTRFSTGARPSAFQVRERKNTYRYMIVYNLVDSQRCHSFLLSQRTLGRTVAVLWCDHSIHGLMGGLRFPLIAQAKAVLARKHLKNDFVAQNCRTCHPRCAWHEASPPDGLPLSAASCSAGGDGNHELVGLRRKQWHVHRRAAATGDLDGPVKTPRPD